MFFIVLGWILLFIINLLFFPRLAAFVFACFFIGNHYEIPDDNTFIHFVGAMSCTICFLFDLINIIMWYKKIFD